MLVGYLPLLQGQVAHAAGTYLASSLSDQPVSDGDKDRLWHRFPVDQTLPSSGQNAAAHPWSQQAFLLGNGTLGTFMYGDPERERIHINDKTLWRGGRINPAQKDASTQYDDGGNRTAARQTTISALNDFRQTLDDKSSNVFGGAFTAINSQLNALQPGVNTPMGQYNDFGNMYLEFPGIPEYSADSTIKDSYVRSLDMSTGVSYVNFDYAGTHYKRASFTSHPDGVGVTQVTAEKGSGTVDFNLFLTKEEVNATYQVNVTTSANATDKTVTLEFDLAANQLHAAMQIKVLTDGTVSPFTKASHRFPGTSGSNGLTVSNLNGLSIAGASYATLVYATGTDYASVYPSYRTGESKAQLLSRVSAQVSTAAAKGYTALETAHTADFSSLYDRVKIDLDTDAPAVPTDEMVRNYRNGQYSRVMEEQEYQMGRYLTIAGSRAGDPLPTNLCGLWMVGNGGTYWNADFHMNINLQMNYWPTMQANLAESMKPLSDFVESLVQPGRLTGIRSFVSNDPSYSDYDANYDTNFYDLDQYPIGEGRGFLANTTVNPYGFTAPNAAQEYGYNVGGTAWALLNLYEYYLFTGDEDYLKNTLYPMLKEQAKFYDRYLWYSPYQDRLIVGPSVSAEHGPTVNGSTYDQSIAWELYDMAIAASSKLGVDADLRTKWTQNQTDLKPALIGADGQIKEWFEETRLGYAKAGDLPESAIPAWNPSLPGEHRHANHLFGLYPGTLITQDNPTLMNAAKVSLINRGFEATGWSKAWKLNMWARTGDAENSYKLLQSMNAGYFAGMLENLLDSHPPFQIDGNYGYTAGMQEMLLQSQNGYIEFLPTLPEAWATGDVRGFLARGNFTVDMNWSDGTANTFRVQSNKGKTFTGRYPGIANATVIEMRPDGTNARAVTPAKTGTGQISFPTTQNRVYVISFNTSNDKLLSAITAAQNVAGAMSDAWLNAPKALLNSAIAAAQTASAKTGTDHTAAINQLNKSVNTAKAALALADTSRAAQAYQEELQVGELPWQYTDAEKAAFGADIQAAVDVLIWATGSTKVDEYASAEATLNLRTAGVRARTDALAVTFSWTNNSVTMSAPYPEPEIRYTLDGSAPGKYSNIYVAPVAFNNATTIRAALFHDGAQLGDVTEYFYRNTPDNAFRTATVTASQAGGMPASGTNGQPARAYDGSTSTSLNGVSGSGTNTIDFNLSVTTTFAEPITASSTRVMRSTAASANYWINKFRIEYSNDGGETWTTAYTYDGPETTPTDFFASFPAFTATTVRLHVLEGWAARIVEWELYDGIVPLTSDKDALTQVAATYQAAVDAGVYPDPASPPAAPTAKEASFIEALSYAKAVLANEYADQATVDHAQGVADALVSDLGLEPKHDEAALIAAIADAVALNTDDFDSDDLVAAFVAAVAEAKAVKADSSALQAQVDQALVKLQDAQSAMEATVKIWSYLNGIVTAAQAVEQDITDGKYLQVNVPEFLDALDAAVVLQSKPKSKQYEINAAAASLLVSLGKLVTEDKAELFSVVDEATALYDQGLAAVLTPEELGAYNAAYEAATAVLYNPNASQAQVASTLSELTTAVEAAKAALKAAEEAARPLEATAPPSISGTAVVGKTLTATTGSWVDSGLSFAYQWLRNGAPIPGATNASYTVVSADVGTDLQVRVTASKTGRADGTSTSGAVKPVKAGNALTKTPTPTVSGTAKVGKTLKAKAGTWAPAKVTLKYQWLRDGKPIAKATKTSYKLVKADAGHKISVQVTGSKSGYVTVAKISKAKTIAKVKATVKVSLPAKIAKGKQATAKLTVTAAVSKPTGTVKITVNGKTVTAQLTAAGKGKVSVKLPAIKKKGSYKVKTTFTPTGTTKTSTTKSSTVSKTLKVS